MHFTSILTIGLLAGLSAAAPASNYIQHQKRNVDTPDAHKWVKRSRAPAEASVPVRVALAQRNRERGHAMLMDISNPYSPNYGQYLAHEEIGEMFAPEHASIDTVRQWLHEGGVDNDRHLFTPSLGYLKFNATLGEVESLLQTQYHIFEHSETGEEHVACDEYHLPGHVRPHIDFVTPTVTMRKLKRTVEKRDQLSVGALPPPQKVRFTPPASLTPGSNDLSNCAEVVTPVCIRAAYGIPLGSTAQAGNELGVFEDGDYYDKSDLNNFFAAFTSIIPQNTFPALHGIDGGQAPVNSTVQGGPESVLDFEISIPLIHPQTTILFQVDDQHEAFTTQGFGDTFLDALDKSFCTYRGGDNETVDPHYPDSTPGGYNHTEMCGFYKPTNVISVSYGLAEFTYDFLYEDRQCQEYMKLGLAGTTVVYASGDSGVASRQGCLINPNNHSAEAFAPGFPANCPYLTTVGATMFKPGEDVHGLEVAVSAPSEAYYSGGGFSNYYATPSYQATAVKNYINNHAPAYPAGTYNKTGRGYPDVSAVGLSIATFTDGLPYLQGGTSAATPIFASIITLINEKRLAAGKSTVGFINPTLYAHPQAFRDIVSGSNPGCGKQGFPAAPGWDPVTGLGTPITPTLMNVFMSLP